MKEKTKVVTGSIALTGGAYVSAAAMLVVSILFARNLEKDVYGLYMFIISLASMSYLFTNFGVDGISNYFVMRYKDKRMDVVKHVMFLCAKVKVVLTLLTFFALVMLGYFLNQNYWYVALFFVIFVPNHYTRMFLDSFQHFRLSGQLQIIESVGKLILVYLVLTYVTTSQLSIIILAVTLPMVVCIILATRDILKTLPKFQLSVNFQDLKQEAYHYGKWFMVGSVLSPVIANVMQVTLGLLNELGALAVFGVGKVLSNVVLILATSFKSSMSPSFIKKTDVESVGFALTDSIRYMLMISIFLAFLIHFISVPLVTIFYTVRYIESAVIFEILTYGIIFSIVFIGLTSATVSIGKPDLRVKVDLINAIVVVVAALFLIPKYGAIGAAVSLTAGLFVATGTFAVITFKYIECKFPWDTLTKCVLAGFFALIPLQFVPLSKIYLVGIDICVGGIVYILLLYVMKEVKQEDIRLLRKSTQEILNYLLKR